MLKNVGLVVLIGLAAWAYHAISPPQPRLCGVHGGPPVTKPRIKLRDGRHLAYKETGVANQNAKFKIVYAHSFSGCRHDVVIATHLSQEVIEELGLYIVSFDRPGYGESDPHPNRTKKSMALDVEELADQLELGQTFYLVGFSMGGHTVWSCLKYIPHRLAGAAMLAPVVNYWWKGFPSKLSKEAFEQQLQEDQWAQRVSHYIPWLTYWWNTQKLFPASSVIARKPDKLNQQDLQIMTTLISSSSKRNYQDQIKQQGEYESIHRDMMIGFGRWEFSPMELKNIVVPGNASVHLWQGDEDGLVPVTLQRYIIQSLPWIKYHEIAGAGHMFPLVPGMAETIIRELLLGQ